MYGFGDESRAVVHFFVFPLVKVIPLWYYMQAKMIEVIIIDI